MDTTPNTQLSRYATYAVCYADTLRPFYIGQTSDFNRRQRHHLDGSSTFNETLRTRIDRLRNAGIPPVFKILAHSSDYSASLRSETEWIAHFASRGYNLVNLVKLPKEPSQQSSAGTSIYSRFSPFSRPHFHRFRPRMYSGAALLPLFVALLLGYTLNQTMFQEMSFVRYIAFALVIFFGALRPFRRIASRSTANALLGFGVGVLMPVPHLILTSLASVLFPG